MITKPIAPLFALSYPWSPSLCLEAVVDRVGKPWIFIQCSCLIAPLRSYESALCRTWMLLPNDGMKVADWLLRGFIQCANIQVIIARSITAFMHNFGGCGYDDALFDKERDLSQGLNHSVLTGDPK